MKRTLRKPPNKEAKAKKKNDNHFIHGHQLHLKYMEAVPVRARLVAQHLQTVQEIFGTLLSDENFVTLLRAESLTTAPLYFQSLFKGEKTWV